MDTIFVSIETTGLRKDDHELIQLNLLDDDGPKQIDVKADKEPDPNAMKFNGLDHTKGLSRGEFSTQYGGIFDDKLVVLHCGKFTLKFLLDAGIRVGKFVDVMEEARTKELPMKLNALAKHFSVDGTKCEKVRGVYEALND